MMKLITLLTASLLAGVSPALASPEGETPSSQALPERTLQAIGARFHHLIDLANQHDITGIHDMFWQSPSALLVAKSAIASEGNWAGFWGNAAIDQKLHDIAASGPVVLTPDYTKLKVTKLARDIAETYAPMNITVSYAGQDGRPKPFLMIVTWKKVGPVWRVASEVIVPVPPAPPAKS